MIGELIVVSCFDKKISSTSFRCKREVDSLKIGNQLVKKPFF